MNSDIKLVVILAVTGVLLLSVAWVGWFHVILTAIVGIGIKVCFTILGAAALGYAGHIYLSDINK